MNTKHSMLPILVVLVLLIGALIPISSQQNGTYDPWLDYTEDGVIDVNDLHLLGQAYGLSGDPTRNVNVTNWPVDAKGNIKMRFQVGSLNLSLVSNQYLAAGTSLTVLSNIDGYKNVYVAFYNMGGTGTQIGARTYFIIGGVSVYTGVYTNLGPNASAYTNFLAIGPTIKIIVTNEASDTYISIGLYAIAS